jgi:hypothetical protein
MTSAHDTFRERMAFSSEAASIITISAGPDLVGPRFITAPAGKPLWNLLFGSRSFVSVPIETIKTPCQIRRNLRRFISLKQALMVAQSGPY